MGPVNRCSSFQIWNEAVGSLASVVVGRQQHTLDELRPLPKPEITLSQRQVVPCSAVGSVQTDTSGRPGAVSLRFANGCQATSLYSVGDQIISTVIFHVVVIINQVRNQIAITIANTIAAPLLANSIECAGEPSHSAQARATRHGECASDLSDHHPASHSQ